MSVFHPSARVRLVIRTEEYANTAALEQRLPPQGASGARDAPAASRPPPQPPRPASSQEVAQLLTRNEQQLRALAHQRPHLSAEDFATKRQALLREREQIRSSALVRVKLKTGGIRPDAIAGAADDLTVIGSIIPTNASIERAGLNAPNTFSITMNYTDAPFDPRSIRSCGVELLVGVIPPEQAYQGLELGQVRGDGSLVSTIGDQADGSIYGATRIVGFVDEWTVKYSGDGDVITLEGRDMSAPFRDLKLNPGDSIDLSLPLDEGIQELLDTVSPTTSGVVVRYAGDGRPPVPSGAAPHRRRPRRGKVARRGRRGDEEMTLWDHITDVCAAVGMIPLVKDFEVVVSEARTLYSTNSALRMVYGKNLDSLEFSRRLAGVKVPTIEVRCYDPSIGRTRWARYPVRRGERTSGILGITNPPAPLRANEITPSGAHPTESIRTKTVSGVTDTKVLERIARNAFEQIGRQEIEGQFSTYEVSTFGHDPFEVDLLDARPADPVEVLIVAATSEDGPISTLSELQAFTRARRKQYLTSLGWDEQVAARFSALQDANGFQSVFRIQDLRIDFDNAEGIKIGCGFINYITVREDGPAPTPATDPTALRPPTDARTALQTPLFTEEGPAFYSAAFAHNRLFSVPSETQWNTTLTVLDEAMFKGWVAANKIPFDVKAKVNDYDMRRFWLEVIKPGGVFEGGHFPDTYKTPFDTTFSAESVYATPDCPFNWQGDKLVDERDGQVVFFNPEN